MFDLPWPMTFATDRWKSFKALLISLAFVAGSLLILGPDVRWIAIAGIVFFGGAALFALATLVVPSKLLLDEEGFRWRGLRSWRVAWGDVERFRLEVFRRNVTVYVDYKDALRGMRGVKRPRTVPVGALHYEPQEVFSALQAGLARARGIDPALAPLQAEAPPLAVLVPRVVVPWLSLGIAAVLCLVFAAEIQWPVSPPASALQPSTLTLAAFGALSRTLAVNYGEWGRLFTAPFLHASLQHLLFNGVALLLAGRFLEGYVGRAWFGAIYVVGGLAGGLGSMLWNAPTTVSVGASGAILGLFAALCVCSFHLPHSGGRRRMQSRAISVLLPTLLSLGKTNGGLTIDFGAHLGGAIGGALIGLLLLTDWSSRSERPARERLGLAISVLGVLATIASSWPAIGAYTRFQRSALLIPVQAVPTSDEAFIKQAPDLLTRYPHDPRVRIAMGFLLLDRGDAAGAEAQARQGLDEVTGVREFFNSRPEASLWMLLGRSLAMQKNDKAALEAYAKSNAADETLPGTYYFRAQLLSAQGNLDAALRDAERYAALMPKQTEAWDLKGDLLFAQGRMAEAVGAYNEIPRLNPSIRFPRLRGMARFLAGDQAGGEGDLEEWVSPAQKDLYPALWLDIVRRRMGHQSLLNDAALRAGATAWPAPVLSLYLGTITSEELLRLAAEGLPDPKSQICEADFYIAEWNVMQGHAGSAREGFDKAARECPAGFVESGMAKAELKAMPRP